MKLFRFDKHIVFAILFAFGFSATAFAGGGGGAEQVPGCGKNDGVHCTGKVYRCLKNFGHTRSYARNPQNGKEQDGYCLPKVAIFCKQKRNGSACANNDGSGECNMKEWSWSLDLKNDTVTETERSKNQCYFTSCEQNGFEKFWYGGVSAAYHVYYQADKQASAEPVDAYFYCAEEGTNFHTIAKCVDKKEGKAVSVSNCDNDAQGTRYYYKPNCNTEEECNRKMEGWDRYHQNITRFCYKPWEQRADANMKVYEEAGGQTIRFPEFQYKDVNGFIGPCEYSAFNKMELDWITDTPTPLGNLVILDKDDAKTGQIVSRVHTKVSGTKNVQFRIFEDKQADKVDSGLSEVSCSISNEDNVTANGNAVATFALNNAVGRALARATGKSTDFIYTAENAFPISGKYKIKCEGKSKEGESREAEAEIFVAPDSYEFNNVRAEFANSTYTGTPTDATCGNGRICENLLSKTQTLQHSNDANKVERTPKHDNKSWARKPVVKMGNIITISVAGMKALNANGEIDTGVSESTKINGVLGVDSASIPNTFTALRITNADSVPPTTATANNSLCNNAPELSQTHTTPISNGMIDTTQGQAAGEIMTISSTKHAIVGEAVVQIFDLELHENIKQQEAQGLCNRTNDTANGNTFPCPYPTRLGLNFEYEIVPHNFKVEVLDDNDNLIKVLYFGQGTSPKVEKGNKIRVTALDDAKNTVGSFDRTCAAQNMKLQLDDTAMTGSGFYFELINKDGTDYVVKADKFKEGVAESEVIIKVQKDKDTPFTPAMKSEPVIIDANKFPNGFPVNMGFANFPATSTYYPSYDNVNVNEGNSMVILRGRINAIDTDNGSGNSVGGSITPTKVWYEFQCEYCNLDEVAKITGADYSVAGSRSPTQQGWWIDKTFGENNANLITSPVASIEGGGARISSVSSKVDNGLQTISYNNARQGTHKLNILHGNFVDNAGVALSMPYFLLYNAYWTGTSEKDKDGNDTSVLTSGIRWNTSSFIYVKGNAPDDKRNYGVDTDGAKNTRSGGRTGKF